MVHFKKREEKGNFACLPKVYAVKTYWSAVSATAVLDANKFRQSITIRNPAPSM